MFYLNVYSRKGLSAWLFPWTCCLQRWGGGCWHIVTTAHKLNTGDYFAIGFCWKHTEHILYLCKLKQFHSHSFVGSCNTHRWSYVVLQTSFKMLKWKMKQVQCVRIWQHGSHRCHMGLFLWVCVESKCFSDVLQWCFQKHGFQGPSVWCWSVFKPIISITCRLEKLLI